MDRAKPEGTQAAGGVHAVPVFAADALRVLSGANAGDALPLPSDSIAGDYYRLADDARPATLMLQLAPADDSAARIGAGSALGRPGDPVTLCGSLSLMAPDGDLVEVLVLEGPRTGRLALPLSPLRPRQSYTLIAANENPGPLRLAGLVTGAFARGTCIALQDGRQLPVEALMPGQQVITRDHGAQLLRWKGAVRLRATGSFAPVTIRAGVMGNPAPLVVSPYHRLFLYRREARPLAGMAELLVQARHLVDGRRIIQEEGGFIEYFSLVFDRHEIIYAEGVPCESLLVCPETVTHLPAPLAEDLRRNFPGLEQRLHTGAILASPFVP
ncbi:Hint domain-containing protein [Pararhodobacter sp.]|uniref:Hint domain-containing protein n=1 Tax=Pararhodobacter sp. TaxID=2127056 RepID=UPI002FDCF25A